MSLFALLAAPALAAVATAFSAGSSGSDAGPQAVATRRFSLFLATAVAVLVTWGLWPALVGSSVPEAALAWFRVPGGDAVVRLAFSADGLNAWLAMLVVWLTPVALLGAGASVKERMRDFAVCVLAMEALMLGALLASDLVVFYLCFEGMLIPMVLITWMFGGADRRGAALSFVLYTMAGSLPLLLAIWWIARATGTLEIALLPAAIGKLGAQEQALLFFAFVLAFAVKVPLPPLHGWQARMYAETPGAGVVLLAGAMAKLGVYGLIRFVLPFFPALSADYATLFIILGLIATVGGALVALSQDDAKKLLAFSSLSHLGLAVIGVFTFQPAALTGVVVLLVAHGLSVAALFLLAGYLESRTGNTGVDDFGGLANRTPILAILFVVAALASAAMPGTLNFIGEFQILAGAWKTCPWIAVVAGVPVILGAAYMLILVQRWFYGRQPKGLAADARLVDASPAEALAVAPLLIASLVLGFWPAPVASSAGPVATTCAAEAYRAKHSTSPAPAPGTPIPVRPPAVVLPADSPAQAPASAASAPSPCCPTVR